MTITVDDVLVSASAIEDPAKELTDLIQKVKSLRLVTWFVRLRLEREHMRPFNRAEVEARLHGYEQQLTDAETALRTYIEEDTDA
mgnify:CR=1 FL=1